MESKKKPVSNDELSNVSGGANQRDKFVSMSCSLERARKEHNAKFHPQLKQ